MNFLLFQEKRKYEKVLAEQLHYISNVVIITCSFNHLPNFNVRETSFCQSSFVVHQYSNHNLILSPDFFLVRFQTQQIEPCKLY